MRFRAWMRLELVVLVIALIYPFVPFVDVLADSMFGLSLRLDRQLVSVFIFAILALGLNLQVGYAGLLQLGIAAFFAFGAFSCGILTVDKFPFQLGFWGALGTAPPFGCGAGARAWGADDAAARRLFGHCDFGFW